MTIVLITFMIFEDIHYKMSEEIEILHDTIIQLAELLTGLNYDESFDVCGYCWRYINLHDRSLNFLPDDTCVKCALQHGYTCKCFKCDKLIDPDNNYHSLGGYDIYCRNCSFEEFVYFCQRCDLVSNKSSCPNCGERMEELVTN